MDRGRIIAITYDGRPVAGFRTDAPRALPGTNMIPPDATYSQTLRPIEPVPSYFDSQTYQEYLHGKCLMEKGSEPTRTLSVEEYQKRPVGVEFGEFGLPKV